MLHFFKLKISTNFDFIYIYIENKIGDHIRNLIYFVIKKYILL